MMSARKAYAARIGRKIVQFAKSFQYPSGQGIACTDCGFLPTMPITGFCGHTRCTKCVEKNKACPCGVVSPKHVHLNVVVQDLIQKMLHRKNRSASAPPVLANPDRLLKGVSISSRGSSGKASSGPIKRCTSQRMKEVMIAESKEIVCPKVRYQHAQDLLEVGEPKKAVIHLAYVAASNHPVASRAMIKLFNILAEMFKKCEPQHLTRELYRGVRGKNTIASLYASDFECNICFEVMWKPVTTYCGHTFCNKCILRTLDERKQCPLCCQRLEKFDIVITKNTSFIFAAMAASKIRPPCHLQIAPQPQYIPLFICTVAFPTLPCPFLILGPYHRTIIRRILDAGTRKVGVVTYYKDRSLAVHGTVVEVRDCVQLEDGSTMLSTVGITRFEREVRSASEEGHIARVMFLKDIVPSDEDYLSLNLEKLAQEITDKVFEWFSTINSKVLKDIEDAFGPMPTYTREKLWWRNPDCPKWLWWIVAILPFSPELQVLMLSTINLHKRMLAVSRTLDVIIHIGLNPSICY